MPHDPAILAAEYTVSELLRKELDRAAYSLGLPMDSPLALRVLRALERPVGAKEFCVFCGMAYAKARRWQRFCSMDCRNRYHGHGIARAAVTNCD